MGGSGGVLRLRWDRSSWSDSFLFFLPPAAVCQQISVLQPSHILDGASWLVPSQPVAGKVCGWAVL